ncbi:MAG: GNAT family N-acetyltransferase [Deltaproteobacteria bacterium]|nr:MAG: GNAT family N-acetyltransferase [Deltaproteobacteria bacterium]
MAPQARVRGPARPRSARHEQGAPGRTPRRRPERRRHAYRRRRLHGGRSRLPAGRRPSRLHAAARPGHGAAPHRRRLPGRADGRGRGELRARELAARRDRPRPAGGPPLRDRRAAAREGTPRGAVVSGLVLRAAESRDVEPAGDVNFVAFYRAALAHGLVPAVTTPADSRRYIRHLLEFDPLGGVVAEEDDRIVGVGWVHPRGAVATLGPIAVDPGAQGRGIGRRLLERAVELAGKGLPQVRLVQESFNAVSLGLYLRAGFRIVAPILELELGAGTALVPPRAPAGAAVRPAAPADAPRLVARDARAFGAPRLQSIDLYLRRGRVLVAEDRGALAGYAMGIGFEGVAHLGSAAADDAEVLLCLAGTVASELAAQGHRVRTMVPAADRRLVEGLMGFGFRVFRACHYMVRGGGTAPPPNYLLMNGDMM